MNKFANQNERNNLSYFQYLHDHVLYYAVRHKILCPYGYPRHFY